MSAASRYAARVMAGLIVTLAAGCPAPRTPPKAAPATGPLTEPDFRFGSSYQAADESLQIDDASRLLWIQMGSDTSGAAPRVVIVPPVGLDAPEIGKVVFAAKTGDYFATVRFFEPGPGYRLQLTWTRRSGQQTTELADLPPVGLAAVEAAGLTWQYEASPSIGHPARPAVLHLESLDASGNPVAASPPTLQVTNPCGYGPSGTFSAVPQATGTFTYTLAANDMVSVTGNYRIQIFPISGQATWMDFSYETR